MAGKKPWAKHAYIERVEWADGRINFETFTCEQGGYGRFKDKTEDSSFHGREMYRGNTFSTIEQAEKALDEWWAKWLPRQETSRTRL